MGNTETISIDGYGSTPEEAILSLDTRLFIKYDCHIRKSRKTGSYFIYSNNRKRFVQIYRKRNYYQAMILI